MHNGGGIRCAAGVYSHALNTIEKLSSDMIHNLQVSIILHNTLKHARIFVGYGGAVWVFNTIVLL